MLYVLSLQILTHVCNVPHRVVAIIGRVLAKWRQGDAVVQGQAAELERLEELGHALGLVGDKSGARGRVLSRREVWNAWCGLIHVVRLLLDVGLDGVVGRHCGWCCEVALAIDQPEIKVEKGRRGFDVAG